MRVVATALALAAVLGACGDDVTTNDGLSILTHDDDVGMDALGTFTLELDEDRGCLFHDEPDNNGEPGTGGRVVIVWPPGFSVERTPTGAQILDETGAVVAVTGTAFQIGGGGGAATTDHCDAVGTWIANGGPIDR